MHGDHSDAGMVAVTLEGHGGGQGGSVDVASGGVPA